MQNKYNQFNQLKISKNNYQESFLEISKLKIWVSKNYLPSVHIFDDLSENGKRLCDFEISSCEEIIDEHALSFQFSGSEEERNRKNNEFLIGKVRLLTLRREYMKILMPTQVPFKVFKDLPLDC